MAGRFRNLRPIYADCAKCAVLAARCSGIGIVDGNETRKELFHGCWTGRQLEPKLGGLFAKPRFHSPERFLLTSLKYRFVVRLPGFQQVIDDPGEFVCRRRDCLWFAHATLDATKEFSEIV